MESRDAGELGSESRDRQRCGSEGTLGANGMRGYWSRTTYRYGSGC